MPEISAAPTPAPIHVRFFAAAAEAAGAQELRLPVPAEGIAVMELLADLPRMVREQGSSPGPAADSAAGDADRNPDERPERHSDHNSDDGAATLSLERVCARSSVLINGVRARTETSRVRPGDQLDVLPPFAGG
ncbi:molybdopterin converting factor [Nesterenkonia sp. AN1]|uniref:ThiS family protein n=1 Tax=Nesterenkonia aurantiaca TaxID=1436010 RepID=A0A4R7G3F5_9MICC|nr:MULTISPECIES: MoaD/ThiS family protein [Nesterenkonia]EXF25743.1 molybdopterin converting factor [Nesterenkonia sp. AN1]TDS85668.1 ThiS family protein [Nesterenkonia aurantiaca]